MHQSGGTGMPLQTLPTEILLLITHHLSPGDLARFLRTNRHLNTLLAPSQTANIFRTRSPTYGRRLLYSAAARSDTDTVQRLLARGIEGFVGNGTLLNNAVITEADAVVLCLVEAGVSVNTTYPNGETPLWLAAARGRVVVVRALLGRGGGAVDVNACSAGGRSALMMAAMYGWVDVVEVLLEDGRVRVAAVDDCGRSAVDYGLSGGRKDVVDFLVSWEEG